MTRIRSVAMVGLLPLLAISPVAVFGQDVVPPPVSSEPLPPPGYQPGPPPPAYQQAPPAYQQAPPAYQPAAAQPAPVDPAAQPAAPLYTIGQLDQMLAPIALYPDTLLTQILMASTFPIQVVEAERWVQQNPANASLRADGLVAVLQPLPWDPSVKSLVPFPQILKQLNDQLDWTQSLGAAFANQQPDVMARVQALRLESVNAGKLTTTAQLRVVHEGPTVIIEPADPAVVYVPVYNPIDVYGTWAYAEYPPLYFEPPPGFYVGPVGIGIGYSVGFGVVGLGPFWGWGHPAWGGGNIVINNDYYSRISYNHAGFVGGSTWHHVGPVGFVGGAGFHGPGGAGFHGPGGAAFHGPGGAGFHGPGAPGFHGPAGSGFHGPATSGFHGPGAPGGHGPAGSGFHAPASAGYHAPGTGAHGPTAPHPMGTPTHGGPSPAGHGPVGGNNSPHFSAPAGHGAPGPAPHAAVAPPRAAPAGHASPPPKGNHH
jgi:Protein of unknown function (DUF3300)